MQENPDSDKGTKPDDKTAKATDKNGKPDDKATKAEPEDEDKKGKKGKKDKVAKTDGEEEEDGKGKKGKKDKVAKTDKGEKGDVKKEKPTLSVSVRPYAVVYIDNKKIQQTPLRDYAVSPGSHTILLVNDIKGKRETIKIKVSAGEKVPPITRNWD